jgi:hypothetical protein
MNVRLKNEDIRWEVVKSMLDEFPALRVKVEEYLREKKN